VSDLNFENLLRSPSSKCRQWRWVQIGGQPCPTELATITISEAQDWIYLYDCCRRLLHSYRRFTQICLANLDNCKSMTALFHLYLIKAPAALCGCDDSVLRSTEFPFTVRNAETDKTKVLRIVVACMKPALIDKLSKKP
jgi:hypothetical protein